MFHSISSFLCITYYIILQLCPSVCVSPYIPAYIWSVFVFILTLVSLTLCIFSFSLRNITLSFILSVYQSFSISLRFAWIFIYMTLFVSHSFNFCFVIYLTISQTSKPSSVCVYILFSICLSIYLFNLLFVSSFIPPSFYLPVDLSNLSDYQHLFQCTPCHLWISISPSSSYFHVKKSCLFSLTEPAC